ncbi:cbb3-type cytochrome c oxidase subunit 3 [Rhizobium oryzicola]|uniref:Cbb3-type cytochrome c oxidase subunit 3 n=2 Tax=Rhizobium oryzicola TaxID=1232668 RepID=A0ABT8SZG0_9HYPH|nr:cbb3-type cytochrome c oxidase subunit 3 [Rhizobium oryzicola]MDO1583383.1 cbb3-type cytochrome c oxidase subunit 3 [Rhizobium oryzicola]
MDFSHETVVWAAKTFGLIYLVIFSMAVVAYAFWPSRQKEFHDASAAILKQEDRPWR